MREDKLMVERRGSKWKNYFVYGLTAFIVIAAAILLVFMFVRHEDFGNILGKLSKALAPVLVGGVFAYVMNPLMSFIEGKLKLLLYKHSRRLSRADKAARVIAIILTLIIVLLLVSTLFYMLIPQIYSTAVGIGNSFSGQVAKIEAWYGELDIENTGFGDYISMAFLKVTDYLQDLIDNRLLDTATNVLGSVATGVWSFIGTVYNILIGLIFSIYILGCKEKLSAISKKVVYSLFNRRHANTIVRITRACHSKFTHAITGKIIDSIIVGILCYVCMLLFDIPYPSLVSVIVGVTNVIPFFGPFIGAIPCSVLIFFANPISCLYFIILIVVIQQLDSNLITPKVVGDSIGLSPLWVLFACTFFGSLWGVVGMLIGAPLMACIYMIIKEIVENKLYRKGLMTETSDYLYLESVDETEMFRMPATVPAQEAEGGQETETEEEEHAEYVPASVKELNRAAGREKYTADSDFEHDEPDDPVTAPAPDEAAGEQAEAPGQASETSSAPAHEQPHDKNPLHILKGLKHRK